MTSSAWLFGVVLAFPLFSADFCAVRLKVVDSLGSPADARVELIGPSGRVVEGVGTVNGDAAFCDLDFGEHTIRIGGNRCGFVTLHRIRLVYGVAQYFRTVLNDCMIGSDGGVFPPACLVYFRVSSEEGKKLGDAQASADGVHFIHADTFGRIFISARNGKSTDFVVASHGYMSKTVHVTCVKYEQISESVRLAPE
jgi:hypothetical protein